MLWLWLWLCLWLYVCNVRDPQGSRLFGFFGVLGFCCWQFALVPLSFFLLGRLNSTCSGIINYMRERERGFCQPEGIEIIRNEALWEWWGPLVLY